MTLQRKAFSDIITFSRASNATVTGSDGLIQYAPHNLLLYSEQFDNAYYSKIGATISANASASPDGTVTADKIVSDASTGSHVAYKQTVVGSGTATVSIYAKAGEYSWLFLGDTLSTANGASFNLATGALGTVGVNATATVSSVGNGWYRCAVTFTAAAGSGIGVYLASANNTISFTGDGTSGIYVWGAQLNVGPRALSYTPTTSAAVYGPRFDYDPVSMAPKGLLIEEQRTNLLTYSEQFDNAAWVKTKATITANAVTSPDGTVDADKLVEDTTTGSHYVQGSATVAASTNYTFTVYLKAAERTRAQLILGNYFSPNPTVVFNLQDGTVVSSLNTTSSPTIQSVGGGWYRCSLTGVSIASSGTGYAYVYPATEAGASYTGDGTSGIYVWGAQLEAGSFATSYIPTVASQVTRSADVASVNTLSPWYNATEGTLYASGDFYSTASTTYAMAAFNSGSSAESISLVNYGGTPRLLVISSSTVQAEITAGSTSAGAVNNMAGAYASNNFAYSRNGSAASTDTSGTVPSVTTFSIGALVGTTNALNGHIRRIAYYPRRLTNSELQALTA